jgi:hypothetical protein
MDVRGFAKGFAYQQLKRWRQRTVVCAAKLPTPVLTGSGSKGLSQPTAAGTPASEGLFDHEAGTETSVKG